MTKQELKDTIEFLERLRENVTKQEIRDAIDFLQRLFVGPGDVDRLEAAIKALKLELQRRNKK